LADNDWKAEFIPSSNASLIFNDVNIASTEEILIGYTNQYKANPLTIPMRTFMSDYYAETSYENDIIGSEKGTFRIIGRNARLFGEIIKSPSSSFVKNQNVKFLTFVVWIQQDAMIVGFKNSDNKSSFWFAKIYEKERVVIGVAVTPKETYGKLWAELSEQDDNKDGNVL